VQRVSFPPTKILTGRMLLLPYLTALLPRASERCAFRVLKLPYSGRARRIVVRILSPLCFVLYSLSFLFSLFLLLGSLFFARPSSFFVVLCLCCFTLSSFFVSPRSSSC